MLPRESFIEDIDNPGQPGERGPPTAEDTGIDFTTRRAQMVEQQLRARGISDQRVLAAMGSVPREEFVPRWMRDQAYADHPLEIGGGQTISQPYVVAATLEAALVGPKDRLLDVGTGSGYGAAVASLVAGAVFTIERLPDLGRAAARRLQRFGYGDVATRIGDGSLGWPEEAPFDVIVAGAAGPTVPPSWKRQLSDGGRIVAPIGPSADQHLVRITRTGDDFVSEPLFAVRYVPLVGDEGFPED